jgi:hypothetical protein
MFRTAGRWIPLSITGLVAPTHATPEKTASSLHGIESPWVRVVKTQSVDRFDPKVTGRYNSDSTGYSQSVVKTITFV